jgi:tetratricopeptide (TPR) repeat protein
MAGERFLFCCALLGSGAGAAAAEPPTFAHDVAPIVYRSCAPCHRPGQSGPFPLLTYADVHKHDRQIATVTHSRFMPPWLPDTGHGEFAGEQRLTDAEIRTIADWVSEGSLEGDPAATPPPPHFAEGWQLGTPDLVLEAPAAFSLPASGVDVYWNFVFRPELPAQRYVRAVEIRPGDRRLVHHANLLVDRLGSAHQQETAPGGFPGMDVVLLRSPFDPEGHFLFWKPGAPPPVEPDGFAWRLDPGNELVLNTHMHPSGKPEQIRPVIGLYFTDKPQTRFPLILQLENDRALNIPPGVADFPVSDDFTLPLDIDVLAVYPHAHYLGKLLEAYATLPDGSRKWLIRIPAWDPAWQAVYTYREPVFLPKGSTVSMRYHYDNSAANVRNPNQPPKRVTAGNQSTDEMAHLWLQALPRGAGDRRRELQEAVMRHRLQKNPSDFEASFNLGAVLLSRLNARDAVGMLETAVHGQPNQPEARNMLGLALATTGRTADAIVQYQAALRLRPDYAAARFNLANALLKAGHLDDAIDSFRQALAVYPDDPQPRQRLAQALDARGRQLAGEEKWDDAAARYRELVSLVPKDAQAHNDFGLALLHQGKSADAVAEFDRALAIDPANASAKANRELALRGR